MKKIVVWSVVLVVLWGTPLWAQRMYVTENIKITLRTGQGTDHKIISMVPSGQLVDVLAQGEQWSQVRLPNGKEGYLLNRYLTQEEPSRLILARLRNKQDRLITQVEALRKENASLKGDNKRLSTELASTGMRLSKVSGSYSRLKKDSSEFLTLQDKYKKATTQLTEQTNKAQEMEAELTQLRLSQKIWWFISGAGVLFLGFVIGFSSKRQRRRSSLL